MDFDKLVQLLGILGPYIVGAAALITAIWGRKTDTIRAQSEQTLANNDTMETQMQAAKLLAESAKDLVGVTQSLMSTVRSEVLDYSEKNKLLEKTINEIKVSLDEYKRAVESLKEENLAILKMSKRLVGGVNLLLQQMKTINAEPVWTPPQELLDTIDRRVRFLDLKAENDAKEQTKS